MYEERVVALSFYWRKPKDMYSSDMWGDSGEKILSDVFCKLLKYSFCSLDKGRVLASTIPVRRASPKVVKLSISSISLSRGMVNGMPSSWERYALFREVSTFSISSGSSIWHHWSDGSVEGILFQMIVASIGISMNFMPLNVVCLVWCLMDQFIFC